MIDAVSNVAEIRGKGAEKMVVLVDGDNVSLLGPGSKMKLLFFLLFFYSVVALALNFVKSLCIHGNCNKKTGWVVLDLTLFQPQSTQIIVVKEEL